MIKEKTTLETWKSILKYVLDKGYKYNDHANRTCIETQNLLATIQNPEKDITDPIELLNKFEEWIYPPLEEIKAMILKSKMPPEYVYSYGPRIFNYKNKINQVNDFIIPLLKQDPNSRRAIITLFDPVSDSNIKEKEIISLISLHFKITNHKLNLTGIIRSSDMFFGWPANVYQLYILQEQLANKLNTDLGSISSFSISAHLFKDQIPFIKKILK